MHKHPPTTVLPNWHHEYVKQRLGYYFHNARWSYCMSQKVCAFVNKKLDWKLNDETNVVIKLPCRNLFCSGLNFPWKGEGQPDSFSLRCLSGYFCFGACHYSNSLHFEISTWQSALCHIELTIRFASKCPSPSEYVEGMLLTLPQCL